MSKRVWRIEVDTPAGLDEHLQNALFTAVADAAYDWENEYGWNAGQTKDWDVSVSAHVVEEEED